MFEKAITSQDFGNYMRLMASCRASNVLAKMPLADLFHTLQVAINVNQELIGDAFLTRTLQEKQKIIFDAERDREEYGEEVDHLANAGKHCCKCPARVTCKARQDYLTNAFNTTDTHQ